MEFAEVITFVVMRGENSLPNRLASARSKLTILLAQISTERSDCEREEREKSLARAILMSRDRSVVVCCEWLSRYLRVSVFVM